MSFKTSVLIWFSRSRGTASPPDGVRLLCETEEHDKDIVTYEHRGIVT